MTDWQRLFRDKEYDVPEEQPTHVLREPLKPRYADKVVLRPGAPFVNTSRRPISAEINDPFANLDAFLVVGA